MWAEGLGYIIRGLLGRACIAQSGVAVPDPGSV